VKEVPLETGGPWEQLQKMLQLCVKCGRCRAVCPVFKAVGAEPAAARGKLALLEAWIKKRRRLGDRKLREVISLCLLCGRCTANCPNGAGAREAVELARCILARENGLAWSKKLLSSFSSTEREARDPWIRGAGLLQRLLMRELPRERGLVLRLGATRLGDFWAPKLKPPFFLERHSEKLGSAERRVGLFVGCTIHYLAPEVGDAALKILNKMGYEVLIPKGQGCCGLMAMGMGDKQRASLLARKVVELFHLEKLEAVLVPCASCAYQLTKGIPELLSEGPLAARAKLLAEKVKELSVFLAGEEGPCVFQREEGDFFKGSVAYHDPCHLAVGLGIRGEPRKILRKLRRWSFKEMEGADECCGMGGSFRLFHPGVSARISGEKLERVRQAEVDAVATSCMGCWMGLKEMLHRESKEIQVKHICELVWEEMEDAGSSSLESGGQI